MRHGQVRKKSKNKGNKTPKFDKSRICPDHPRCDPPIKLVMCVGVPDVVNNVKFRKKL